MNPINPQLIALIDAMNDRPIAFNRHYVSLGCGINGALMLSQMVYWSKRTKDNSGYFYKTHEEWEEETGLTRREQDTARKRLRELGFTTEVKRGVPCKVHFKVEHNNVYEALIQYAQMRQSSMAECAKLECTNAPNKSGGMRPTITENTTEITTENISIYKGKFDFAKSLLNQGANKNLVLEYMEVRAKRKATNSETAFKNFISEQQKSGLGINQVLEICVTESWKGFKAAWLKNQNQNPSTAKPKTALQATKDQWAEERFAQQQSTVIDVNQSQVLIGGEREYF